MFNFTRDGIPPDKTLYLLSTVCVPHIGLDIQGGTDADGFNDLEQIPLCVRERSPFCHFTPNGAAGCLRWRQAMTGSANFAGSPVYSGGLRYRQQQDILLHYLVGG